MRPDFPAGFRASCVALALWCGALAHAAEPHPLVGATREQVLTQYGEPRSTLAAGNREVLFYARERLVLRDGRVVDVEPIAAEPGRRPAPAAPTPSSETAPRATTDDEASAKPAPGTDAASTRSSASAETPDAAQPTETETPPPPPEPKLEIKRVLPPGTSTRPAAKQPASTTPATSAQVPSKGTAQTTGSRTATPTTPPATTAPSGPAAGPFAGAPGATVPSTRPTPVASSPNKATATATETPSAAATTSAAEPDAAPTKTDVASKTDEEAASTTQAPDKKAADAKAASRPSAQAQADALDPTAGIFTTRTYVIALFIIGGGIGYLWWRHRQRQLLLAATAVSSSPFNAPVPTASGSLFTAELLGRLEWKRFEELVAAYYSKTGVVAVRTKDGPSAPVHIKISWKGEPRPFALVQCIAQPPGLVDAKSIQELHAVLTAEDIRRGYVVTSGKFNVAARDFAEEKHITLLPGDMFLEKLNALPDVARAELMQQVTVGDFTTPSCPKCEAKMTRSPEDPSTWRCVAHPEQQLAGRR